MWVIYRLCSKLSAWADKTPIQVVVSVYRKKIRVQGKHAPDSRGGEVDLIMRTCQLALLVRRTNIMDVSKHPRLHSYLQECGKGGSDKLCYKQGRSAARRKMSQQPKQRTQESGARRNLDIVPQFQILHKRSSLQKSLYSIRFEDLWRR